MFSFCFENLQIVSVSLFSYSEYLYAIPTGILFKFIYMRLQLVTQFVISLNDFLYITNFFLVLISFLFSFEDLNLKDPIFH